MNYGVLYFMAGSICEVDMRETYLMHSGPTAQLKGEDSIHLLSLNHCIIYSTLTREIPRVFGAWGWGSYDIIDDISVAETDTIPQ